MRKETVEIVGELVDLMQPKIVLTSVVNNLDGTFTFYTENTSYLSNKSIINISTLDYKIIDTDLHPFKLNESFTVESVVDLTLTTEIVLNKLNYKYGTFISVNGELDNTLLNTDKYPLIYLMEVIKDDFNEDDNLPLDRSSELKMFFLCETDENNWYTIDHYNYSIGPMRNVIYMFIDLLKTLPSIGKISDYSIFNHSKFGVYIESKGHTKRIFGGDLSGCELNLNLPIMRQNKCNSSKGLSLFCESGKVTNTDGTFNDLAPSGGTLILPNNEITDSDGALISLPAQQDFSCTQIQDSLYNPVKTGSFSVLSGDDGQTQAGRGIDRLTLDFINPFGNTLRFTNDLGGSHKDNSDGSTPGYFIDNATKLGYTMTAYVGNMASGIAHAQTLIIGPYGGFRVPNINEWVNIMIPDGFYADPYLVYTVSASWIINKYRNTNEVVRAFSNINMSGVPITHITNILFVRNHIY